jgi:long-chain acyl-CoA synthetase
LAARTLIDRFEAQVGRGPDRVALRSRRGGVWRPTTWGEWRARVRAAASGLVDAGVRQGDRVAIFAQTREEWVVADLAILHAGAVTVPIYPTLTAEQTAHVLRDSGARVVFADDARAVETLLAAERTDAALRLDAALRGSR